jgi:alpha-beta hydrolase superfamily lysophospholipase
MNLFSNEEAKMLYQKDFPGDWGQTREVEGITIASEKIVMADGCKLFLRSWKTDSATVLLLLHGLGGHGGWYIDMANELSSRGLTVYTVDHRGFGRSDGPAGHVSAYQTFVKDIAAVLTEIHRRHPNAKIYLLGHSMGAIFATYVAAAYHNLLAGVIYLNPWVEDSAVLPKGKSLAIFVGGLFKSRRAWQVAGDHLGMSTNPEAHEMLQADSYWQRTQTASFLVQILQMRLGILKQAKNITLPAIVMQAENDKAVLISGSRKLYEALASSDKTWQTYPNYAHDSEFETDRSQMDSDIVNWIQDPAASPTNHPATESETHR